MQATSSSLNTLWHHLEDSKLRKTQQTFGLNLRCSLHVFCFVLVLFLKAQRLSPTRRPEKPKLLFPLQPTSCNHQQAAIECLGVDTAGFEDAQWYEVIQTESQSAKVPTVESPSHCGQTLLTVIFFAIGFLMLQVWDSAADWTVEKRSISALTSKGQDPLDTSFFLLFKATQPRASPKEAEIDFWWLTREKSVNYPLQLYDKPHIPGRDMLSL